MKEKLISRLIVGALAGFAAAGAYAGQIQSSSVSIAREAITDDTQVVNAPSASYRFAGDVDARVQTQTFQVQLKLQGGATWNTAAAPSNNAFAVTDGIDSTLWTQNATAGASTYQVIAQGFSTDKTILYVTIQVDTFATKAVLKQPLITFNASGATTKATVLKLKTVVGDITECDVAVKNLAVDFAHYNGLSAPAQLATGLNATADEHVRAGATNTGTLMTFPTNILVKTASSTGDAKIDVASAATKFAGTTGSSWISATLANLGNVSLVQNATGYDSNLTNQYLLAGNVATNADNGVDNVATATKIDGNVEATNLKVVVTATQGFQNGGTLFLNDNANCAGAVLATQAITSSNAAGPITLTIPNTIAQLGLGAAGTGLAHVCYTAAGTNVIPASAFSVVATLTKAAGTLPSPEQNNFCKGNIYALGGAIKIDVRNYANSKDPNGWMSVIRLINNSEVRTIDVWGQIIQVDGKYGPYGKVATLAPREAKNLTSAQVDALLTTAPASAANGDSTPQATATGARLRLTSENGSTLRVQNYLFNPASKNFIEASSTQGVDFEGSTDRAPASEGQYQDQDAQKGLNGK